MTGWWHAPAGDWMTLQRDTMAMWLAERKDALHHILKSGKLPEAEEHAEAAAEMPETAPTEDEAQPGAAEERRREKAAQSKGRLITGEAEIFASLASHNIS